MVIGGDIRPIIGGSGGDAIRGVLGGAGGAHSHSRRSGKYFDRVDGEAISFCASDISIIFGVLVSKDSCLMSSRARNDDTELG